MQTKDIRRKNKIQEERALKICSQDLQIWNVRHVLTILFTHTHERTHAHANTPTHPHPHTHTPHTNQNMPSHCPMKKENHMLRGLSWHSGMLLEEMKRKWQRTLALSMTLKQWYSLDYIMLISMIFILLMFLVNLSWPSIYIIIIIIHVIWFLQVIWTVYYY